MSRLSGVTMNATVEKVVSEYLKGHVRVNCAGRSQEWALVPVTRKLGPLAIGEVTPTLLRRYVHGRAKEVVDGTIRRELSALKAAVEWCRRNGVIPRDTIFDVDLPPDSPPRMNALSEDEHDRLWGLASALALDTSLPLSQCRIGMFICLAMETAARESAVRGLTWDRVDMVGGFVDFRDPNKKATRKRRVVVPISKKLMPVLVGWEARTGKGDTTEHVLGHAGMIRGPFERFRARHGFDGLHVHDLRRTWATLRARWGASMEDIAAVLGDSVVTTEKHYAHFSPGYLRGAVDMVGRR
jgi:integrase